MDTNAWLHGMPGVLTVRMPNGSHNPNPKDNIEG